MLNRIPHNIPPLTVLLAELGATPRQVARALQVSERTVYNWLQNGREPWSARIALFWLTRWGYSIIHTDAENAARLYAGLARSQADYIRRLENFSGIKKAAQAANDAGFGGFDAPESNTQCRK